VRFVPQGPRSPGTVGVVPPKGEVYGSLTTPILPELHRTLDHSWGWRHSIARSASSHGLDHTGSDGLRITAAGFTNPGPLDHLDDHARSKTISSELILCRARVVRAARR